LNRRPHSNWGANLKFEVDLRAAKGVGLLAGFVPRPLEYGSAGKPDLQPDATVDVTARDFSDLAAQLGA
jgi:2-haloacid dehalogenase